ncbi:MAG: LysR family transcriptional regulator [Deltaproteobacteria bacterium]|nr:LysR family transcriptional regulator [Deltaproteobacteria bacterium]
MDRADFGFRELEIFCKVVELESFSRAAAAVFLAQASVSERVASLEKKVGTRLLDRLGRKVIPTSAGEILHKHATLILEMKKNAQQELESFLGLEKGEVSMGGSTIPGEYILPDVISRFKKKYPHITVNLSIAGSGDIEQRVLGGGLELGVIGWKSSHPNLLVRNLWSDELVLAVPAYHPWAGRTAVPLQELTKAPFIMRQAGSGTLKIVQDHLAATGKDAGKLNIVARVGSSTAVKEGIKSGLGLSILSSRAIKMEMEAGVLKALKIEGRSMLRGFYLIRNRLRMASPACRAMADFLRSSAEEEKS